MIAGTDEQVYINVFALRNFAHIDQVSILYEATYGRPLSIVVTEEFKDDMGNALVAIREFYLRSHFFLNPLFFKMAFPH